MWDVDFQTRRSRRPRSRTGRSTAPTTGSRSTSRTASARLEIETSRPELIPACVALVVNPSDERYAPLVGTTALTPLFRAPVPIVAHELADPEKGTGAAQICTFGDVTDVMWWRELGLPARVVIRRDGTLASTGGSASPGGSRSIPAAANAAMAELAGRGAKQARRAHRRAPPRGPAGSSASPSRSVTW